MREQNMVLYTAFIDLTKTFDTVHRKGHWRILSRLGCPPKSLTILQQLHTGQQGQVKHNGEFSDSFLIENGVKQGCILAPTLLAIFFSVILREAKVDLQDGIYIRVRTDGRVFNLRRLMAHTKTSGELINDLLYAEDCALLAHTEEALQPIVTCFAQAATAFGLTIRLKKTEVIYQKPPRAVFLPPNFNIDWHQLNAVEHFAYLRSVIYNDATTLKDVDNRTAKPSSCCGRLQKRETAPTASTLRSKVREL